MIYAISDLHGSYKALEKALAMLVGKINLEKEDKLIFLGDYIDRGNQSKEIIERIIELQKDYGSHKVITLIGNHEEMFINWLNNRYDYLTLHNGGNMTVLSFLNGHFDIEGKPPFYDYNGNVLNGEYKDITNDVIFYIKKTYPEIMEWFNNLKYIHEEDDTIFVHAGLDETPGKKPLNSSQSDMTWKYPATYGHTPWNKVIVAGHIMTRELHPYHSTDNPNSIFRSKDHIYIDGAACVTGTANVLACDTKNSIYYDAETMKIIQD